MVTNKILHIIYTLLLHPLNHTKKQTHYNHVSFNQNHSSLLRWTHQVRKICDENHNIDGCIGYVLVLQLLYDIQYLKTPIFRKDVKFLKAYTAL